MFYTTTELETITGFITFILLITTLYVLIPIIRIIFGLFGILFIAAKLNTIYWDWQDGRYNRRK